MNIRSQCVAVWAVTAAVAAAAHAAPAVTGEPQQSAQAYLAFESVLDGRCDNLSAGGKLRVVRNTHPARQIRFRLARYFVDVRQQGLATGTAAPGDGPISLGCTQVDGRPQRWEIERAEFVEEPPT